MKEPSVASRALNPAGAARRQFYRFARMGSGCSDSIAPRLKSEKRNKT